MGKMSPVASTVSKKAFRKIALRMLSDDNGISERTYNDILPFIDDDIRNAVDATDGRWYISDRNLVALKHRSTAVAVRV